MTRTSLRPTIVAISVFVVVYVALDLNKLYALRYGADLGTYLQTLVNLRHGSSWNYGEWRNHFQVHDSWALGVLAPLIWVLPRAETLVVVQVLAVGCAAIPLALLGRELGLRGMAVSVLAAAYLLSPAAHGLAYDNFSENAFVPLLALSAVLAVRRRSFWATLIFAQLLMGVKEDQILFMLWFGAACALWWDRRIGAALLVLAAANGIVFWGVERALSVRPNDPQYGFAVYDLAGKVGMVVLLLAPFAFAPVATGRWLLLALPLLAEIVFMKPWNYEPSRVGSHYTASLLAATAAAAAFGFLRAPAFARAALPCAILVTLFLNDTVLRAGRWPYVVDWPAYARAVALRDATTPMVLRRGEEGVWAVAAVNPKIELDPRPDPQFPGCPGYNTNAGAFFGALRGRMPAHLCGGVPVAP